MSFFYVSSEDIDPNNKNKVINKIKKIPQGPFHNARFDIDASSAYCTECLYGKSGACASRRSYGCTKCITHCDNQ